MYVFMKLYLIYKFGDLFPMIVTLLERLTRNKYSYSNKSVLISALLFRSRNPRRLFRNVHHSRIRSRACCSIREGGRATEFLSLVKIFCLLGFIWRAELLSTLDLSPTGTSRLLHWRSKIQHFTFIRITNP